MGVGVRGGLVSSTERQGRGRALEKGMRESWEASQEGGRGGREA